MKIAVAKNTSEVIGNTFIRGMAAVVVLFLIAMCFKDPIQAAPYMAILHRVIMGVWWAVGFSHDTETKYIDSDIGSVQRYSASELVFRREEGRGLLAVGAAMLVGGLIAMALIP